MTYNSNLIKKSLIIKILFFLCQFIIYRFLIDFGRDTDEYIRMAKGIGSQYLEGFWQVLYTILEYIINSWQIKFFSMFFFLVLGSYLLLNQMLKMSNNLFIMLIFFLFVLSIQISSVGGALRQGICIVFFTTYLLTSNKIVYLLSIFTHWSGTVYILLNKYIRYLVIILAIIGIFYISTFSDDPYIKALTLRIKLYLSNPFSFDFITIYVIINKVLLFVIFIANIKVLRNYDMAEEFFHIKFMVLFSPFLQLMIFLMTNSHQILQRGGMILDPFNNVATVYIIIYGGIKSKIIMILLLILKLFTRLSGLFFN